MQFSELNLNKPLIQALDDLGYTEPTTIQEQVFGPIMAGKDVVGIAQTGTGKTMAYLLPIIRLWKFSPKKTPDTIIIVPTRELVVQVCEEFEKLAKYTSIKIAGAYGGTNIKTQMAEIASGVDVVVATSGRIVDLILNRTIPASQIKRVVIDEVDELLKLGFRAEITQLIELIPTRRQTLMFSATMNAEIDTLAMLTTHSPMRIETSTSGKPVEQIQHFYYEVKNAHTKINLIRHLLKTDSSMKKVLIFGGGKRISDLVHAELSFDFPDEIAVIHGNKNQNTRLKTLDEFESGECRVLIATDLLARGIDVTNITHVIHVDVPEIPESYIHRSGRTGRAGQSGKSIVLCSEAEKEGLTQIMEATSISILPLDFPSGVEVSDILLPDETHKKGMKIIQVKKKIVPEKGAAFHEKKDKNKKVPIKLTREDKQRLRLGKLFGTKHGGLGKGKKKK